MNIENVEGGVSPLKAKRQSSRGGKHAGKATAKKGNYLGGRGGYAKSRGVRGAGGRNVGGYNIHTRFQPRKTPTAPSGSGKAKTESQKPYSYDEDGNIEINIKNVLGGTDGVKNENTNINENINTNINNEEKETEKIKKKNDLYYKIRKEEGTTTKEEVTSNSYKSQWESDAKESYQKKHGEYLTRGTRYMKYGHSRKMDDEYLKKGNLKGGSYHKTVGGRDKVFHTSFEGYVEYMDYAKTFEENVSKERKSKVKSSKSSRTRTKTVTKGGRTFKQTWEVREGGDKMINEVEI
jgi:hypothetical protein